MEETKVEFKLSEAEMRMVELVRKCDDYARDNMSDADIVVLLNMTINDLNNSMTDIDDYISLQNFPAQFELVLLMGFKVFSFLNRSLTTYGSGEDSFAIRLPSKGSFDYVMKWGDDVMVAYRAVKGLALRSMRRDEESSTEENPE